jgi:short-subunit dehydrogenase
MTGSLVLLTGASSGIGRHAAIAFAGAGARVVGLARRTEALESVAREIGDSSRFVAIQADVADEGSMARATSRISTEFGTPDIVVANAGVGLDALFTKTTDEALLKVFDVNVFGLVRTVRPFVDPMVERGSGRILLISSIVGKRGIPYYSAYSASKFALHGMAEALRAELWGSGVTVGLVCPGSTETEFQENALRNGPKQRRVRPRRHSAESVARVIVRMAGSRRREVVIGVETKALALASRLAPGLVDRMLARMLRS